MSAVQANIHNKYSHFIVAKAYQIFMTASITNFKYGPLYTHPETHTHTHFLLHSK